MADFIKRLSGFANMVGADEQRPRRILLDADAGNVIAGGDGAGGDVQVRDAGNRTVIFLDAGGPDHDSSPVGPTNDTPLVLTGNGWIRAGGASTNGLVVLRNGAGKDVVHLSALNSSVSLQTPAGELSVSLRAAENGMSSLRLGAGGQIGNVALLDDSGQQTVTLLAREAGTMAGLWAGGSGRNGWVITRTAAGVNSVALDGEHAQVRVHNAKGELSVNLRGTDGSGRFGGQGTDGEVHVLNDKGDVTVSLKGNGGSGWFGGRGVDGDVLVFAKDVDHPDTDNAAIWLQGNTGDIVLRNADCAEEFDVHMETGIEPGAVLVLRDDGRLALCHSAYDSRVVGVLSGADGIRPGIVLGRVPGARDRMPIALAGKVMCNVDADFGAIRVGDLLTTSTRPGFAMVATDRERAFGAVIGKAMAALTAGSGRVPILVGLQ